MNGDRKIRFTFELYQSSRGMETLISLFSEKLGLDTRHFELFYQECRTKHLKRHEHLIREGSVCKFIGVVMSGTFRSYVTNENGEHNNDFYFDNHFVSAYTSFLTQMSTNCNIEALTDSTVLYISFEKLNKLVAQDDAFLKLGKYVSDTYFIRKCRRETSFLKQSAAERYEALSSLYPAIEQHVSQYHIASYLGVKPESLSRIKLLTYINK